MSISDDNGTQQFEQALQDGQTAEQTESPGGEQTLNEKFYKFMAEYDAKAFEYPVVVALHRETSMSPFVMSACVAFLVLLLLATGCGFSGLTTVISFAYPLYASYKSLQLANIDDERAWLIYWIIFATLSLLEQIFWFICDRIPYYFAIKMIFLSACWHPRVQLAKKIHRDYLDPLLKKYGHTIDTGVSIIGRVVESLEQQEQQPQEHEAPSEGGLVVDVSGQDILDSMRQRVLS